MVLVMVEIMFLESWGLRNIFFLFIELQSFKGFLLKLSYLYFYRLSFSYIYRYESQQWVNTGKYVSYRKQLKASDL